MILDYEKVLALGSFVYCDVNAIQFSKQVPFSRAVDVICRSLGVTIHRFRLHDWCAVSIQRERDLREIELYSEHGDFDRAAAADFEGRRFVLGASMRLCEVAAVLMALDAGVDVFVDEPKRSMVYSLGHLESAGRLVSAVEAYISQYLWFGDVPQNHPYWADPLEVDGFVVVRHGQMSFVWRRGCRFP